MKLAFLSDFHLGFSQPGREKDAFENALSAMKSAVKEGVDAIVFTGDFFHHDVPKQETLLEALRLLSVAKRAPQSSTRVVVEGKAEKRVVEFTGIPFIGIHGTHEFRGRDFANVLEILDKAGFMAYIHAERAFLSKHREKVVLHGLGGVPEKKALDALKHWNPVPEAGACNILLLHQSFKEFLPFEDEMVATLSISDLPKGFDLIVNGHIHWGSETREEGIRLLMPGSTVVTQMKKLESKKKKAYFVFDTKTGTLSEREIKGQRPFHYSKLELKNANPETAKEMVIDEIEKLIAGEQSQKPLVKIKLTGSLSKGFSQSDLNLAEIKESFGEKAIVSFSADFHEESFGKKMKELSAIQAEKKSVSELGLELLEKNLAETDFGNAFDPRRIFSLLKNNDSEKAMKIIASLTPENPKNNKNE